MLGFGDFQTVIEAADLDGFCNPFGWLLSENISVFNQTKS